uniref:ATP synthase peripheral stalk subunit F6, mitochondrial n=1 Tax=Cyprinus carpio TaxID=7962 RepID=A0A8C1MII5_CYPCA
MHNSLLKYIYLHNYFALVYSATDSCLNKQKDVPCHINIRISLTSAAQLDPVQKLFLEKIREYSTKSQAYGGPVDAGPEYETAFSEELNKLQRLYGSGDLTEFPEFKFSGGCLRAVTL